MEDQSDNTPMEAPTPILLVLSAAIILLLISLMAIDAFGLSSGKETLPSTSASAPAQQATAPVQPAPQTVPAG